MVRVLKVPKKENSHRRVDLPRSVAEMLISLKEQQGCRICRSGICRTNIYYCDAGCPCQNGDIEVNYELIRQVLPKGTCFDNLTQADVTRMMDHINSYNLCITLAKKISNSESAEK